MKRTSYIENCINSIISMAEAHIEKPYHLLELFAGKGSIFTQSLSHHCLSTIGWDINPDHKIDFEKNIKNSTFYIVDTVESLVNEKRTMNMTDEINIISIDNPLGFYGELNYCEHFELIKNVNKIVCKPCILAINIVKRPYDMHKNYKWVERRKEFYNIDYSTLDLNLIKGFYNNIFNSQGLNVKAMDVVKREEHEGEDYFYMLIIAMEPIV